MTKREFATWCATLNDMRLAQVSELCFEAVVTFEGMDLGALRDSVRRALEDCWAARLRDPLKHALELMKDEAAVVHRRTA